MSDFLDSLYDEKDKLQEKVDKLENFIDTNSEFTELSHVDRVLLVTQLNSMKIYLYTLEERLWVLRPKEDCEQ